MSLRTSAGFTAAALALAGLALAGVTPDTPPDTAPAAPPAEIPRIWTEEGLTGFELPLADPAATPVHLPPEHFYRLPERPIWKSYPVYHPDREPAGYLEELAAQEPRKVFDPALLTTEAEWIAAGELVFESPITVDALVRVEHLRDPEWYRRFGVPVAADGTVPFFRYVVQTPGQVQVAQFSCATCHTRVLDDGTVVKGAPGNLPLNRLDADDTRVGALEAEDPAAYAARLPRFMTMLYGAPWLPPSRQDRFDAMSLEEFAAAYEAIPTGVQPRFGASLRHPVVVPDLIGVRDRRFLDRTGHVVHRDVTDLGRYAVTQQDTGFFARYGEWIPAGRLPDPDAPGPFRRSRYGDAQLLALGRYLYSLQPPPNPNPFDERAGRGETIFVREGCPYCHTPPLYTNNKLTPVDGFKVPEGFPYADSVVPRSVGTDPGLALDTRRGTGFYKVPSLRGVWYRGPYEHSGSVATLEDWFDPRRLRDDYRPTGFRGAGVVTRAVPGHPFGLDLTAEEKADLIAFLRTL